MTSLVQDKCLYIRVTQKRRFEDFHARSTVIFNCKCELFKVLTSKEPNSS